MTKMERQSAAKQKIGQLARSFRIIWIIADRSDLVDKVVAPVTGKRVIDQLQNDRPIEQQIDEVPRLIAELKHDNFDVDAALWLYTSDLSSEALLSPNCELDLEPELGGLRATFSPTAACPRRTADKRTADRATLVSARLLSGG
jgi:hypothetical protein